MTVLRHTTPMRERGRTSADFTRFADFQDKDPFCLSLACASGWCEESGLKVTAPAGESRTGAMSHERSGWLSGDRIRALVETLLCRGDCGKHGPLTSESPQVPESICVAFPNSARFVQVVRQSALSSAQLVIRKERIVMRTFTRLTFVAGAVLGCQLVLSASAQAQIAISPWFVGGGYYGGGTADGNFMFG